MWLGADGRPGDPPPRPGTAVGSGIGIALSVLILGWGGAVTLSWCAVRLLTITRNSRWDAEWRDLTRPLGTE